MSSINSREKGKRGELELAGKLREYGYEPCRRGQQYCGTSGDADVIGVPHLHIECKRVERLDLQGAMDQSVRDARDGETPVVMHRKNYCDWLVTLRLDDFMEIFREYAAGMELSEEENGQDSEGEEDEG